MKLRREPGRARALTLRQAQLVPEHEDPEVLLVIAKARADDQVDEECDEMPEYIPDHLSRPAAQHPSTL